MTKVINNKNLTFQDILKKAKYYGKKFICFLMTLFFLGSYGCGQEAENESNKPTPTPFKNAQLSNDNNMVVGEEDSMTDASSSPMDPVFITPEPVATPIPIVALDEDQLVNLEVAAKEWYKKIKSSDSKSRSFDYNEDEAKEIAKRLCGDFSTLKVKDDLTEEEKVEICLDYHRQIEYFISSYTNNLVTYKEIPLRKILIGAESNLLYRAVDPNKYEGLDMLTELENLNNKLYYSGINKENYEATAMECFNFIKDEFKNEAEFKKMYPLIQLLFVYEANCALAFMIGLAYPYQKMSDGYTLADMIEICEAHRLPAREKVVELLMAYLAMKEQGTYDAYMSGDNNRKEIIKQLMLANDNIRLY